MADAGNGIPVCTRAPARFLIFSLPLRGQTSECLVAEALDRPKFLLPGSHLARPLI